MFCGKADHLAVLKTGKWLMPGLCWNSASVKQRAGYVTLKEMDSFPHMADHARSSVFWTKNRYFISQLGCWTGHISVPIILCDSSQKEMKYGSGQQEGCFLVHWGSGTLGDIMMHKAKGPGQNAPYISHCETSSNLGHGPLKAGGRTERPRNITQGHGSPLPTCFQYIPQGKVQSKV